MRLPSFILHVHLDHKFSFRLGPTEIVDPMQYIWHLWEIHLENLVAKLDLFM